MSPPNSLGLIILFFFCFSEQVNQHDFCFHSLLLETSEIYIFIFLSPSLILSASLMTINSPTARFQVQQASSVFSINFFFFFFFFNRQRASRKSPVQINNLFLFQMFDSLVNFFNTKKFICNRMSLSKSPF